MMLMLIDADDPIHADADDAIADFDDVVYADDADDTDIDSDADNADAHNLCHKEFNVGVYHRPYDSHICNRSTVVLDCFDIFKI